MRQVLHRHVHWQWKSLKIPIYKLALGLNEVMPINYGRNWFIKSSQMLRKWNHWNVFFGGKSWKVDAKRRNVAINCEIKKWIVTIFICLSIHSFSTSSSIIRHHQGNWRPPLPPPVTPSVTRCLCEKFAQNVAKTHISSKLMHHIFCENNFLLFYQKIRNRPNAKSIAQSGHPVHTVAYA
jgi:hypothetical protein